MKHVSTMTGIETFQVRAIEYTGNIFTISNFIKQYGIKSQSQIVVSNGVRYIMYATPWHKASEETPQAGDRYTINPDRSCYIYTSGEFEANFKEVATTW